MTETTSTGANNGHTSTKSRAWMVVLTWLLVPVAVFFAGVFIGKFIDLPGKADFWDRFLTSPGAAGVFAVAAAFIAFIATTSASKRAHEVADRTARRTEWWNRASWALDKITSNQRSNKAIGYDALSTMLDDAEPAEAAFVIRVIEKSLEEQADNSHQNDAHGEKIEDTSGKGGDSKWQNLLHKAKQIGSRRLRKNQPSEQ